MGVGGSGVEGSLCHSGPKLFFFFSKFLSIISHHHLSAVNVLFTCLLPHGCNVAATVLNVMASLKCPKCEGRRGWMESEHSFIRKGKFLSADFSLHFFG